jgi:serine/threonine protein kinase
MKPFSPRPRSHGIDTGRAPQERYRILGRIAAGGMAEIYLGRMVTRSGGWRECVLKRLMPDLQADQEFVQMFYDEARIASEMNHPNIVQIYELGELDGSMFIAMELIRGVNLKELYERAQHENKPIPLPLILRLACGALDALAYAHAFADSEGVPQNIVHRDVSPQNILVTYQGEVKLVDFGVAKAENRIHQTRQGLVKGKFAYMAPEQINGEKVDGRSDLFALAEVLYQFLLHRHPFYAESDAAVLQAVLESRAVVPTSIDPKFPPQLSAILMRAMQRKPENRYADAAAMKEALEAYTLDRARPPTAETLGRYVRELFADRLQLEEQARTSDNDDLLVEALRVGPKPRPALREAMAKKPPRAIPAQTQSPPPPTTPPPKRTEPIVSEETDDVSDVHAALEMFETAPPDGVPDPDATISVGGSAEELAAFLSPKSAEKIPERNYDEPKIDRPIKNHPNDRDDPTMEATVERLEKQDRAESEARRARKRNHRSRIAAPNTITGTRVGNYTLVERAGHDAVSEQFIARILGVRGFQRDVLLKRILPELSKEEVFVEAFLREVKSASRLSHPNIALTLDLGMEEERWHLISEYVPGRTLASIIAQARLQRVSIPVPFAVRIVSQVALALAAAHAEIDESGRTAPVLHRDITAERVIITRHGGVKVTDFGIANASSASMLTSSDEVRGKPDYMAPELLSSDAGKPDVRCDVYSAGMLLYETVTLESPFRRSTTFETIMAALRDPVRAIGALRADVPKPLELIVEMAIARNPRERHPSALALANDLERLLTKANETVIEGDIAAFIRTLFSVSEIESIESEDFTTALPAPFPGKI